MKLLYYSLALYLSLTSPTSAASSSKDTPDPETQACAVRSPHSGNFFDLGGLRIVDPAASKSKHPRDYSWNTTGFDLGYNFTLNFCDPVIETLEDVVGVEKPLWRNVSAYYKDNGKIYSLGLQNDAPVVRGRKLVLNYTMGSPCPSVVGKRERDVTDLLRRDVEMRMSKAKEADDSDKDKDKDNKSAKKPSVSEDVRRKSAVISFLCDKDPLAPRLALSFIGTADECSYFFEARSSAACATIQTSTQTLSPAGVFGMIVLIGILVYLVGGCFYSRAVLQQRGWKQVPNYTFWASIFGFFKDIFIIMTSSCARMMPSRRGYSRVNGNLSGSGGSRRGRGDSDAENRLIDELNEEWDD